MPSVDKHECDRRQQELDAARPCHLRGGHVQPAAHMIGAVHCERDRENDGGPPQSPLGRLVASTAEEPQRPFDWPVAPEDVVVSEKDLKLGRFADFVSPFRYEGT